MRQGHGTGGEERLNTLCLHLSLSQTHTLPSSLHPSLHPFLSPSLSLSRSLSLSLSLSLQTFSVCVCVRGRVRMRMCRRGGGGLVLRRNCQQTDHGTTIRPHRPAESCPLARTPDLAILAKNSRLVFAHDDPSFIVLTETKFSFRCIPVWDRYSPHRTRVEKKKHM